MTAQASPVTFELHSLGWKAFQDLCSTVLAQVLGQTFQTFLPTNDEGRDGSFRGKWKQASGESFEGNFTVQCKFTAKRDRNLTLADLEDELEKAQDLGMRGLPRAALVRRFTLGWHISGLRPSPEWLNLAPFGSGKDAEKGCGKCGKWESGKDLGQNPRAKPHATSSITLSPHRRASRILSPLCRFPGVKFQVFLQRTQGVKRGEKRKWKAGVATPGMGSE